MSVTECKVHFGLLPIMLPIVRTAYSSPPSSLIAALITRALAVSKTPTISTAGVSPRQLRLGGTADGTAGGLDTTPGALVNRVDRLRLLGNGVVNQTAAKAFATLSARLDKHLK